MFIVQFAKFPIPLTKLKLISWNIFLHRLLRSNKKDKFERKPVWVIFLRIHWSNHLNLKSRILLQDNQNLSLKLSSKKKIKKYQKIYKWSTEKHKQSIDLYFKSKTIKEISITALMIFSMEVHWDMIMWLAKMWAWQARDTLMNGNRRD